MVVLRPFLKHAVSALLIGLFLALGVFTLGKALLFDRIFFAALLFLAFFFRKDINLLGVICIIIAERIVEEVGFLIILDIPPLKFLFYGLCLYMLQFRLKDGLVWPVFIALLAFIGVEIYWWLTDYKFINTHWYVFLISLNLLVRKAISSRAFWTVENLKKGIHAEPLRLDYYIYQLAGAHAVVNLLILAEYMVRHLWQTDLLLIHSNYALVNHILAVLSLFLLADQSIKVSQMRHMKA